MSKSVNKTSKENHNLTQEELASLMGLSVPTKTSATKTKNHSIKKVISDRLNEVMHKVLCDEFSEYYYEIGETMVSHKKKNGEVLSSFVKGYQLVIPSEEPTFTSKDGQVTQGGYRIGNFTIYCCGFQTQETPYVIKNGKTIFFKDVVKK
tara:strand:+ start:1009 stop:1458 length:450 start_codon:yes stop_codon:yes gene_type:complete